MGNFANNAVTDAGRLLLADLQAGAVFIPTKIVIGSGAIPSGKTTATMTAVSSPVKDLAINKKKKTADGKVIVGGAYDNRDVTVAWYFRELALFARAEYRDADGTVTKSVDEVLYSYGNAGETADYMPAYSTDTLVERQIDLVSWIGQGTEIELVLESGIQVTQEQKDTPGGIVGINEDGNADMKGGTVTGLGTPVNPSDAVPKEYADLMLPLKGGTMQGGINMAGNRMTNVPKPTNDGDAVPKSYVVEAAANAGSPFNFVNNSDFTNPVNSQGLAVYSVNAAETIDTWFANKVNLSVVLSNGYVRLQNANAVNSYLSNRKTARQFEPGKVYTCIAWFADGSKTVQQVATQDGINVYSGMEEKGVQFAISCVSSSSHAVTMYISGGATVDIKHVAVYEGAYTAESCPKYQPKGYNVEEINCKGLYLSELLWKNASVTVESDMATINVSSAFSAGHLTLAKAVTDFEFIVVVFVDHKSGDMNGNSHAYSTGLIPLRDAPTNSNNALPGQFMLGAPHRSGATSVATVVTRYAKITSGKTIYFGGGYRNTGASDEACIPFLIYGVGRYKA